MEKFKRMLPMIIMLVVEATIGILLLLDGEKFTGTVFLIFGILLMVLGVIALINALMSSRKGNPIKTSSLIMSVVLLVIGATFIIMSANIKSVINFAAFIYGIILIISGVLKLTDSLAMRSVTPIPIGFTVFFSVLSIVVGFVIAFNPFGAMQLVWIVFGVSLIVNAVVDLILLIIYGKAMHSIDLDFIEAAAKEKDNN